MSGCAEASTGRAQALGRVRSQFATVADQVALLEEAPSDRERRSLLLMLITSAWELRDRASLAYEALVHESEAGGIARGVLE